MVDPARPLVSERSGCSRGRVGRFMLYRPKYEGEGEVYGEAKPAEHTRINRQQLTLRWRRCLT
jgi:hypothetical protein